MSERLNYLGQREDLKSQRKSLESVILSHRESIRTALPLAGEIHEIDSEHVMALAITLNERISELKGVDKKLAILDRELGL